MKRRRDSANPQLSFAESNHTLLKAFRFLLLTFNWIKTGWKYRAETHPYRIIWIDPAKVHSKMTSFPLQRFPCCVVTDNDFDSVKQIMPVAVHLQERIKQGLRWQQTSNYKKLIQRFKDSGKSEDELLKYLKGFEDLFYSIKNKGFLPPKGVEFGVPGIERNWKPVSMAINIGRDGGYFHYTGNHRMNVAKLLKLDKVPVRVVARHIQWQKIREEIFLAKRNVSIPTHLEKFKNHPDITYL